MSIVTAFDRRRAETAATAATAHVLARETGLAHERRESAARDAEANAWRHEWQVRLPVLQAIARDRLATLEALISSGVHDYAESVGAWRSYRMAAIAHHESLTHIAGRLDELAPQYSAICAQVSWLPHGAGVDASPWQSLASVLSAASEHGLRDQAYEEAAMRHARIVAAMDAARIAADHTR